MTYYTTNTLPAPDRLRFWGRPTRPASVLHGELAGQWVAITIRVHGSNWVCHPHPSGDSWGYQRRTKYGKRRETGRPPRWVRKAAKMALKRWLA